ncbi:MAG: serine hydrolase domain-containing protein [Rubrivivax sp.]
MITVTAGVDRARLQPLNDRLQRDYIDTGRLPGCQWLLARRGQVVARHALGRMDVERDRPYDDDSLVRIYSMTKPITSVALMMLYEEGRFGLHDPVHAWIPSWREQHVWVQGRGAQMQTRPPRQPVTIRQLLNHSSGLTYGGVLLPAGTQPDPVDEAYRAAGINTRNGDSLQTLVDKLGRVPLRYEPGEAWAYSFATDVCGHLVERIAGMPFERFLQQRLFEPLGMRDTGFTVPADQAHRLAACYRYEDEQRRLLLADDPATSPWRQVPALHSGGGGLVSSLSDYHRFGEMLRRGGELDGVRILGPRTLQLMRVNHLPGDADLTQRAIDSFSETLHQGVGFGLGFATTLSGARAGVPGAGDFYWGGLASTIFWVDPVEDLVAIFLTQLIPSRTYNFRGLFKSVVYGALVD